MIKVAFSAGNDIYIELNGKKLASVQSYKVNTERSNKCIEAFGEDENIGVVVGRSKHLIDLSMVCLYLDEEGFVNFYDLTSFNIVIVKPDRRIVYSGCEWYNINENCDQNKSIFERVQVVARKRTEVEL